ncbi:MAG: acyltransferase [Bacteroides sp.]|nr:acyltransferase [Bacteroides sp.]
MQKERIIEFDYIRVISLFAILICHSFLDQWYHIEWLGRFLGMTFNFLFLILSAFLFGISWENKGFPKYNIKFLKNRIIKLSKSYYPYLVLLFSVIYLSQGSLPLHKVVNHILYLPWFDKIEGYGHLWFLTMIVLCYIGCLITTKLRRVSNGILNWIILFCVSIILGYIVSLRDLPGYIFPYLVGYMLVFRYANWILLNIRKITNLINIGQFFIVTILNIIEFSCLGLDPYSFISYLLGMSEAVSVFCFIYNAFRTFSTSKLIVLLSGISFEVYLVHEFFLGRYSVYKYIPNHFLSFITFLSCSIILGFILNYLSRVFANRK